MTPAVGPQLVIPAGLPRNLEAAIQRYGSATYKAPAATVLDPNGKMSITLTYGKLLSRSLKIAYALLNRVGFKNTEVTVKPGDRVALVYPNNDPLGFMYAFYGCTMAGVVPVPIEVPITRRVSYTFIYFYVFFLILECLIEQNIVHKSFEFLALFIQGPPYILARFERLPISKPVDSGKSYAHL